MDSLEVAYSMVDAGCIRVETEDTAGQVVGMGILMVDIGMLGQSVAVGVHCDEAVALEHTGQCLLYVL